IRRWRRIRHGGGNRHRHRQAACAGPRGRRTAHHLQICGAWHRANPSLNWIVPPGPVADGLRIGLLGGSFNPAHSGHLYVSETALKKLGLDSVWWLVSPGNPLKDTRSMAPLAKRLEGAAKLAAQEPRIHVSALEASLGTRYTVDTV